MLARLFDFIFPVRSDEAIVRALTEEKFLSFLDPHLIEKTDPHGVALFSFMERRVRSVIHEAKYHGNTKAFALLASALSDYLRDADSFGLTSYVLVPIPLGAKRLRERGYNQVEEVAKITARELSLPIEPGLLERTRETASQVSLAREARKENMRGAFRTPQGAAIDPAVTYVILDDVATTGATLQTAIDALTSAGARSILPLAFAH